MANQRNKTGPIIAGLALLIVATFLIAMLFKDRSSFSGIPIAEAYRNCADPGKPIPETGKCLRELAKHSYRHHSIEEIEEVASIDNSGSRNWCHEFMHYVGWELYKNTGDISKSFIMASGKCDSGMYHGVTEEYINKAQLEYDPEAFARNIIPQACEEAFSKDILPPMKGHCYHGLGHAFMFITEGDLQKALAYCDYIPGGNTQGCYTGALMENIESKQVGRLSDHPKKFGYNENDPDYPCNILDGRYKHYCYVYRGISYASHGAFREAFEKCKAVSPQYQETCFWGVGNNIPNPASTGGEAGEKCKLALGIDERAYGQCVKGAMVFLTQINLGQAQANVDFCDKINEGFKDACYKEAGKNLNIWLAPGEKLSDKCNLFKAPGAINSCLNFNSN